MGRNCTGHGSCVSTGVDREFECKCDEGYFSNGIGCEIQKQTVVITSTNSTTSTTTTTTTNTDGRRFLSDKGVEINGLSFCNDADNGLETGFWHRDNRIHRRQWMSYIGSASSSDRSFSWMVSVFIEKSQGNSMECVPHSCLKRRMYGKISL